MSQQPPTMQIPTTVTIDGRLAVQLKEYILSTPSPQQPVGVAIDLIGKVELALQKAAMAASKKNGVNEDAGVLAAARKMVAAADGGSA